MKTAELIKALQDLKVRAGIRPCMGCGYEYNCDLHGCAIIREAIAQLKEVIRENNVPLTIEELQRMVGDPLWVVPIEKESDWNPCWVICKDDYILVNSTTKEGRVYLLKWNENYRKTWIAYRRKQEDAGNETDTV